VGGFYEEKGKLIAKVHLSINNINTVKPANKNKSTNPTPLGLGFMIYAHKLLHFIIFEAF
jgi:hypothetical protein